MPLSYPVCFRLGRFGTGLRGFGPALASSFRRPGVMLPAVDSRRNFPIRLAILPRPAYPSLRPVLGPFGGVFPLAEIRVQEGEPLENALRRFKRKVQTEDIIKEVKRHSFYLKPGEKKRVKEALARKRNRKKIRKEQD